MDFQFRLDGPDHGEFWLSHCGALMDVEPWGEDRVRRMCHDIEDPTFDATAAATNPRMKMRPIHRPPREPAGRFPHCHWSVFIDDEAAPFEQHANLSLVEGSSAGSVPVVVAGSPPASGEARVGGESGGWPDYSGPFDPGFQLEDLSHEALMVVIQEFAVQAHLLVRSYLVAIAERFGEAAAVELGRRQWVGERGAGGDAVASGVGTGGRGNREPGEGLPAASALPAPFVCRPGGGRDRSGLGPRHHRRLSGAERGRRALVVRGADPCPLPGSGRDCRCDRRAGPMCSRRGGRADAAGLGRRSSTPRLHRSPSLPSWRWPG